MIRYLICALLIYPCSAGLVWAQPGEEESVATISETEITEVIEETATEEAEENSSLESSAVERATKPVASWVEEKLQNSALLQPSTYSRTPTEKPVGERTLREAILLAREQFNGSVLAAERMDEEGRSWFRIKILSETGVLRMIDVEAAVPEQAVLEEVE